jgi:biotin carboxyl carrier protein
MRAFAEREKLIACAAGLLLVAAATSAAPTVASAVAPGGVVRWLGEGTERCGMEGESWQAIDGACWYPIDLLRRAGPLTVERWTGGRRSTTVVEVGPYPYSEQRLTIEDQSKVNLSAADLARVERENARIGRLWKLRTPRRFTLPLRAPLAALPDGGRFGARRVINGQPRSPHTGADYAAAAGTPVLAPADGTVALAGDLFFSGNSVFVDHGDGLITMVFHLREIDVREGQEVRAGQRLGVVGSTGRATGPHLHFGVRWRGARVDPAVLLGAVAAVPEVGR